MANKEEDEEYEEFEEGDEEGSWEYEDELEGQQQQNNNEEDDAIIQIDEENDMNDADFDNLKDDDFDDDFDDDADDNGGWDDDDEDMNDTTNNTLSPSTLQSTDNTSIKKAVPPETKAAINDNIDEINMLPMFCGVPDLTVPAVLLGIKIKQFEGISRDQLAVWGLSDYQYIGVRLKFGRWYLHEIEAPSIEIGACNHVSDVGIELEPFRIAWTLQDRCKNTFFSQTDWHQNIKMNQIPDSSAINDLMETTQKSYVECLNALRQNKNDVTKTTEYLFGLKTENKESKKKKKLGPIKRSFLRILKESTSKFDPMANNNATVSQKKKNWKKSAEKTTLTQKIKHLSEVFDMSYDAVKLAVNTLGYDLACEQLTDYNVRMEYVQQTAPQKNKSSKKSWWSFGGSSSSQQQNESKYDDEFVDDDYKLEYKVWDNLKKACHIIPNYETLGSFNVNIDESKEYESKSNDNNNKYKVKNSGIDQDKVLQIINLGMGFKVSQIRNALKQTNNAQNDVVIDYILNSKDNDNDDIKGDNEYDKKQKQKQKIQNILSLGPCPRLTKTSSDSIIHKITSLNETMQAITQMFQHNFFIIILNYILKQLLNSTQNCMICGEELEYPGLKPTICLSPFCQFRLLEIGLGGGSDGGYGLGAEILGGGDIIDFLICCACAAAGNPARSELFFPTSVRGASSDTADVSFLKSDGKTPDVEKLKQVIALCPAIDSMKGWAREGEWSLKEELGKLHCLLYPYLIWVITSNRAYLMKLESNQRIPEIKTEHQFVMRSQTPERAEAFNKKKAAKGSVFYAWHGSGIFNWHSILRMGLKNYSNTKYMSAGAAYGSGIYTAEQSSTSLGYCTRGSGGMTWKGSRFGANVCCMALCEIVGPKKEWDKGNGIYVISDESCVATRYFFLFDSSQGIGGLSANSLTLPKWN